MQINRQDFFDMSLIQTFDQHIRDYDPKQVMIGEVDFDVNFLVGVTFGGFPDVATEVAHKSYYEYVTTTFSLYNHIIHRFQEQNMGYMTDYSDHMITMIAVLPRKEMKTFVEARIEPIIDEIKILYGAKVCAGIGMYAENEKQIHNAYNTSKYAFRLYFFYQQKIINFQTVKIRFDTPLESYDQAVEETFHAILVRNPDALQKIDDMVTLIGRIHFGNHIAVRMRTMQMTGYLMERLQRYKLLEYNLYNLQDNLQDKVLNALTFGEVRMHVHDYYKDYLKNLYNTGKIPTKMMVENVKTYIQENYMEELNTRILSDVACVSPNYFSHLFKNEVGMNYKDYVTKVRMDKAVDLVLNTDYSLNRISEAVGYNNPRTFTDAFKLAFGDSPTKYKKKMQKK